MMRRLQVFALLLLLAALPVQAQGDTESLKQAVLENYADIVFASYSDSYELALVLQEALAAFVAAPSEETLEAAKAAWVAAREPYTQTEGFRFYGGPIDDADGPEGLINAWPMDEVYVDYVEGAPDAGIINNVAQYPTIDAELLESLNLVGAEENISVGYHAIEFLLWGQDLSDDGPGARPYSDYVAGGTAANQERRGQYLLLVADLLIQHLGEVKDEWDPAIERNYRAQFLAASPDESLRRMLTGIGVLGKSELAGERIYTAYDNQDQEDEHSCFSDNTHRDIINNLRSIDNVYRGQYQRVDGTTVSGSGLADLVGAVDDSLNQEMLALLDAAAEAAGSIHVPFDQAIILPDTRETVFDTVNTLLDMGDKIVEVAQALNITIDTALPA